ncbi:MAG: 50S ribosomal protein L6 [Microgenomates group bacterium GW2011_GWF2_45_18]|nr:MAG: 50S ribosomal protein L6 [Microgenomates group bacterium GW2011_GWF1_44_10]KKU01981.1 MAG: 50S ribosomal protein L6 [Microgenomates group bacterium GW2011_GWF2_45_18]OGJ41004.1 MAG: 50S ribosomal protein L6 [Candidatus Pacebacteria bacterium RIFOXYB1_FULL_44_10]HAU99033.1 50S ribosomal protein L6 [Candidatus Paceibacterota bacterium]HAX01252.1 50S ribosomal protein L6 [Candidatus Paceibacterota bacterium]
MSRIGNKIITIPAGVTVTVDADMIVAKGTKGELRTVVPSVIRVKIKDNIITVERINEEKQSKALHGLVRSLIANTITGVSEGYEKKLELVGTGYRVAMQGTTLQLSVGFSHQVMVEQPKGIVFAIEGNNKISVKGFDKQQVGQVAANIRKVRPPEPYKGKGIKYEDEVIRRKAGKAVKAGASA